jgi:hypothetical protein
LVSSWQWMLRQLFNISWHVITVRFEHRHWTSSSEPVGTRILLPLGPGSAPTWRCVLMVWMPLWSWPGHEWMEQAWYYDLFQTTMGRHFRNHVLWADPLPREWIILTPVLGDGGDTPTHL